jgi:hypothetical protein
MAEHKRNQQGNRNQNQGSSAQGSRRRDEQGETQQSQGNRANRNEPLLDDEAEQKRSTDRSRSTREPASIAHDRDMGNERQRRNLGGDPELDELESDIDSSMDVDDIDEDDEMGGGGRSNR